MLERAFGARFTILDGTSGELLEEAPEEPSCDWGLRAEVCREVARRGRVEFIDDEDPFLVLALPLVDARGDSAVAVGTFVGRKIAPGDDLSGPAELLGMRPEEAAPWASRQEPRSADTLYRIAELVLAESVSGRRIKQLEEEAQSLSVHISNTYEEISLLYRLTQGLKISTGDQHLCRAALQWMQEALPAVALAIRLVRPDQDNQPLNLQARNDQAWLTFGQCPVDQQQFAALVEHLDPGAVNRPVVVNRPITEQDDWPCPQVRQIIVVSLAEGENLFGYLAAVNHVDDAEFGTVEASLLSSVGAILGIHSGNIELYRQQSELLEGIIRALTSAIDAKDPYTCGHSDRVARVAVRLAEELGCDAKTCDTIYLAGLLHDIGKIGIDDGVLRKPGKLSEEEYEHIKTHAEIGHKILGDLKKLDDVLPVVLHHHEAWDGGGYPHRLDAQKIPSSARIVAVADAFDAMSSDRPYRQGLPEEKIDGIFRSGAGRQWDPEVIDAFFRARDDIRNIGPREQGRVEVDLRHLT